MVQGNAAAAAFSVTLQAAIEWLPRFSPVSCGSRCVRREGDFNPVGARRCHSAPATHGAKASGYGGYNSLWWNLVYAKRIVSNRCADGY